MSLRVVVFGYFNKLFQFDNITLTILHTVDLHEGETTSITCPLSEIYGIIDLFNCNALFVHGIITSSYLRLH